MSSKPINDQLKSAVLALKSGKPLLALRGFAEILSMAPQHTETRKRVARAVKDAEQPSKLTLAYLVDLFQKREFQSLNERLLEMVNAYPFSAEIWSLKGALEKSRNNGKAALLAFRFAAVLDPHSPISHNNLGLGLQGEGQPELAIEEFNYAIKLKPDYYEAVINLGVVQLSLDQTDNAVKTFEKAIKIRPDSADGHYRLGTALFEMNLVEDAIKFLRTATNLDPNFSKAHYNLAAAYRYAGNQDNARASYGETLKVGFPALRSNNGFFELCSKLITLAVIPAVYESQRHLETVHQELLETTLDLQNQVENRGSLQPSELKQTRAVGRLIDAFHYGYQIKDDRSLMMLLCPTLQKILDLPRQPIEAPRQDGKLRIGIAARLLRNHNGANYCYNWFANLPKEDYEFFTYSFAQETDSLGQKFRQLGTHRNMRFNLDRIEENVADIRRDDLDFLMLPEVGMSNSSRMLSMCRLARLQATGWGHPVTTGSPEMDFFISSDLHEIKEAKTHYSEELVLMPNLAQFVEPEEYRYDSDCFNFETGTILFGCLQSLFKYVPEYDVIFPLVAKELPQARFVFIEGNPPYITSVIRQRLERQFTEHGLDADRHIIFMPRQSSEHYDNLTQRMDILIDTVGWSGGNTSLKALGMDKPLVTLPGTFMRGRHTFAMYSMMGYHDLVSKDVEDMVAKLVSLGSDADGRNHAADMIHKQKHAMYQDWGFIRDLDQFLKKRLA